MSKRKDKKTRAKWFKVYKGILRVLFKKPEFVYLGEEISEPSMILTNHLAMTGPVSWETFFYKDFRFWGTFEMTQGLKAVYRYLSTTYFHQKKHFPSVLAKILAFIGCPFVNLYYKGMTLIPTYPDMRLRETFKESEITIKRGQSLVIFPEDSSKGYYKKITKFFAGFAYFANSMLKQGYDLPVFVAYLSKEHRKIVIDKPVRFSVLKEQYGSLRKMADALCDRLNYLGETQF